MSRARLRCRGGRVPRLSTAPDRRLPDVSPAAHNRCRASADREATPPGIAPSPAIERARGHHGCTSPGRGLRKPATDLRGEPRSDRRPGPLPRPWRRLHPLPDQPGGRLEPQARRRQEARETRSGSAAGTRSAFPEAEAPEARRPPYQPRGRQPLSSRHRSRGAAWQEQLLHRQRPLEVAHQRPALRQGPIPGRLPRHRPRLLRQRAAARARLRRRGWCRSEPHPPAVRWRQEDPHGLSRQPPPQDERRRGRPPDPDRLPGSRRRTPAGARQVPADRQERGRLRCWCLRPAAGAGNRSRARVLDVLGRSQCRHWEWYRCRR